MHITTAEFKNLKGRSARYDFTPATLICGPNYSGKTAIADAVRLTLLGYHPELKKQNQAIMDLASGARVEMALTLSSGVQLTREFHTEGGSAKTSTNMNPLDFETPLLDASAYFAVTANEQIDYVFSKVKLPAEFTPDGVIATLQQISFGEEHTEQVQKAKKDLITICEETFESEETVAAALAVLSDKKGPIATEYTRFNGRVKDTTGAIRVLTELKLREAECSPETLTDIANEISRLQGLIELANTEAGRLTEQQRHAQATARRRDEIARLLQAPAPQFAPFAQEEWLDPRALLEKQLTEADTKLSEVAVPLSDRTEISLNEAQTLSIRLRQERQQLENEIDAIGLQKAEVMSKPCCPFCQGKTKGWQKHLIAKFEKEIEELSKKALEIDAVGAARAYDAALGAHAAYQKAQKAMQSAAQDRWAIQDKLTNAERIASRRQQATTAHESSIKSAQAAYDERMQSLREEQARLVAIDPPPQSELDAATDNLGGLRQQLGMETQKRDAARTLQQHLVSAHNAAEAHTEAAAGLLVCKRIGEEIKTMKGKMVEVAFAALLKVANSICGDILPSPLAYQGGDLGRWGAQGKFIKHVTFSGTEKALAYIGLAAGLSANAPFKLAIIDELGRITPDLQLRVMEALARAVEVGTLDQVIGILPLSAEDAESFEAAPGWSLIRTGEAVAA
jgi:DNA repair exonuclease SbcCD ATPase subunit